MDICIYRALIKFVIYSKIDNVEVEFEENINEKGVYLYSGNSVNEEV